MNNELKKRQDAVIEEFSMFDDWMDKYAYIVDLGKTLQNLNEEKKTNQNIIKGCQSNVWVSAELNNEQQIIFTADSDAVITKGIIALLIRILSGLKPEEIMNAELYFLDKIGLKENLSPTRANGLTAMIKQMKMYALAYHTKLNN